MTGDGIVLRGGRIYRPWTATSAPGGVAIQDGRIAAVGGEDELAGFAAGGARVVDVSGGLVLPGFQDTHVHPNIAGLVERGLDLTELASREEILAAVAAWAAAAPADAWISGWGWGQHLFGPQGPTRGELDAVAGGRPTVLTRGDGHAGWANTAALEAAGLLRPAPDLAGGEVVRGDDGLATGLLQEEAVGRVTGLVGEPTWDQRRTALLTAQAKLLGFGITGWQDASVSPDDARLYAELADSGELAATVIGALRWQDSRGLEQAAEL
ncbi:MAG: amidohydrolase family protein, partial [Bifidobacteriaceae bacterium]|nr:amidohydrolase family protein [Bifidobacteriaceae bacterium]